MRAPLRALGVLAMFAAAQFPALAQTAPATRNEAGVVELIEGGVTITGADRRGRALKKGDTLYEGDAILTAADGELHANLTDGGVIALRPNTQLRITRYQANGDAGDTSIFNLVKGSFRSITGWIARTNPPGYQIRTPNSTLGVRGTDHEPLVIPPGSAEGEPGTYDRVHAGTSFIRGKNGTVDVSAGRAGFFAQHGRDRPRVLESVPRFFRPARNEGLLEGRHERVRQALDQRRGERRKFIEERRAQRQAATRGAAAGQREAAEARRTQLQGERQARREALQREREASQQQQDARPQARAQQPQSDAREQRRDAQQQRREAQQREASQQHEERRQRR
jgi:hypothetical protein